MTMMIMIMIMNMTMMIMIMIMVLLLAALITVNLQWLFVLLMTCFIIAFNSKVIIQLTSSFFLARCVYKHLKLFGIKISILDFVLLKKVGKRKGFEKVVGKSGLASTSRQSLFLYFYTFCISQLFCIFLLFVFLYSWKTFLENLASASTSHQSLSVFFVTRCFDK